MRLLRAAAVAGSRGDGDELEGARLDRNRRNSGSGGQTAPHPRPDLPDQEGHGVTIAIARSAKAATDADMM